MSSNRYAAGQSSRHRGRHYFATTGVRPQAMLAEVTRSSMASSSPHSSPKSALRSMAPSLLTLQRYLAHMRVVATAPVRVADCGGWTDTWFAHHGLVCNIAAGPGVTVTIDHDPLRDRSITLALPDLNEHYAYAHTPPGRNRFAETAVEHHAPPAGSMHITITSAVPAGCGTGTSASVGVALIGALRALCGEATDPAHIATLAHELESVHLGQQSGVQDQWGAALGGALELTIERYPAVSARRLDVPLSMWRALESRLVTVFMGRPHDSSALHSFIIRDLEGADPTPKLQPLIDAAAQAVKALEAGDLMAYGGALTVATEGQRQLHSALIGSDVQRAIDIAQQHDALGWKSNGAGGEGGTLTVLTGNDPRPLQAAMTTAGCQVLPLICTRQGLIVESTPTSGVLHG